MKNERKKQTDKIFTNAHLIYELTDEKNTCFSTSIAIADVPRKFHSFSALTAIALSTTPNPDL